MRKIIEINDFDSVYSHVEYIFEDDIVLLTWKKFCSKKNYRNPTTFAVDLLNRYPGSNFVVDARNGFEDESDDVKWGFSVLLPAMSKTDCKIVVFIMNEVNDIISEMNMWTKEFKKHFIVKEVTNYSAAVKFIVEQ
ncbi:hypothetical protein [Acetobacterium sp.]|jgi:hypothetical protein|uniref:hypothetical protein n=1 Tax=Acetobacterium sp. TaxID=1872094 RepID=UPI000CC0E8DE|nr:hypothetical protein [Acetobacterium sp.]MDO9492107.1 hypothetical protein [Acetobacterium sp.]PKM74633.1 MAG: hypothetical protein CVU92_05495 [Firmicutes bacterium HGW-Firmicutes-17]